MLGWGSFTRRRRSRAGSSWTASKIPKYFDRQPNLASADQIVSGLRSGALKFAVEVPTNFGHDLITQQTPEIGWISGDMPVRAETTRSYLGGVMQSYLADLSARLTGKPSSFSLINIEQRYRYNQSFKSIYWEVPSTIMVMLILIPAIMTALGVVREVETGSIANFRSTPVTRVEFLLGKQLPYVLIGVSSFATLVILAIFVFGVPVKGSWAALIAGGVSCVRRDRVWPFGFDHCSHAGGGGVRHNLHRAHSDGQLLRPARSRLVTLERRARHRPRLSVVLVPADQRRRLHQGALVSHYGPTTWRSRSSPSSSSASPRSFSGNRRPECSGSCSTSSRSA